MDCEMESEVVEEELRNLMTTVSSFQALNLNRGLE
jgi:hypothetical protein